MGVAELDQTGPLARLRRICLFMKSAPCDCGRDPLRDEFVIRTRLVRCHAVNRLMGRQKSSDSGTSD
jgi:hypothetical protein